MFLYNSLTNKKEEFKPHGKIVKMYTCGPTVYKPAHIGNLRAYLFMDSLRRALKFVGYKLNGVMNITDVGHLVSDEDDGEDKIEKEAREWSSSPYEIAEKITKLFFEDLNKLNIDIPEHITKATAFIPQIIELIKKIEAAGLTYRLDDGIYFDTVAYGRYGKLSFKDFNRPGINRIQGNENKRHAFDFALWKFVPENHIMKWNSPWGIGCPGWHIECSAMGLDVLGEIIDIHSGGIDHKTVHHEGEIAQNYAAIGHDVVNTWLHHGHLMVDDKKMSKSLGNAYLLSELEEKGFSPIDFKYFTLLTHYRKKVNFTFPALEAARAAMKALREQLSKHREGPAVIDTSSFIKKFQEAVEDDINMPKAVGVLWKMLKNSADRNIYEAVLEMDRALGLKLDLEEREEVPENIVGLANLRLEARKNKNFAKSDQLRKEIEELGYVIKDGPNSYEIQKK